MKKAKLLVEGQGDVLFFEALMRHLEASSNIEIAPPRAFGLDNTVSHFPNLIDLLIRDLDDSRLDHLGIVADADHVSGGGFANRWRTLTQCLAQQGYRIPRQPPKLPHTGSIFRHKDGLPAVGLYLMPSHQQNGMLEDLLWDGLKSEPAIKELKDYARQVVAGLPHRLFSEYHLTKAWLYTWLAWQKRPGQTLDVTVNGKLLDYGLDSLKGFLTWLGKVFPFIDHKKLAS